MALTSPVQVLLRDDLLCFEFSGPRSQAILSSLITPVENAQTLLQLESSESQMEISQDQSLQAHTGTWQLGPIFILSRCQGSVLRKLMIKLSRCGRNWRLSCALRDRYLKAFPNEMNLTKCRECAWADCRRPKGEISTKQVQKRCWCCCDIQ
jgi:hypothetical protein